jgi:hypothetical protein
MKDGRAELRLADERAMHRGDVATLVPPRDVHNHGHVVGTGPSPYSLILLGDDMHLFERNEYDPQQGRGGRLHPVIQAGRTVGSRGRTRTAPASESLYRAEFIPLG